jgi:4-hydroxythreonine-4-phosphate dehydrogenase
MKAKMKKPLIALTMGDPAGVGPEIILKTLDYPQVKKACRLLIFGDRQVLESTAGRLGKVFPINSVCRLDQPNGFDGSVGLYEASRLGEFQVIPGRPDPQGGAATLEYIRLAARSALEGQVAAMVTCPISKEIIRRFRPSFTGHTEFLALQSKTRFFGMMLAGERLKVSLVTIHLSLKEALQVLDIKKIIRTIDLTHQTLTGKFGIKAPHIAVAGLNPHAGEQGAFGSEEERMVSPAIQAAQGQGLHVSGPYPPDTLFYWAAQGRYDAVVALYHDQGLIPLKLLHFNNAVNITMGLPFIRTSVDHGTAFDIAGKGIANPESLIQAILLAVSFAGRKPTWP